MSLCVFCASKSNLLLTCIKNASDAPTVEDIDTVTVPHKIPK
jgi:hypothetical protein